MISPRLGDLHGHWQFRFWGSLCKDSKGDSRPTIAEEGDTSLPSAHPAFSGQLLIMGCLPRTRCQGYNDK